MIKFYFELLCYYTSTIIIMMVKMEMYCTTWKNANFFLFLTPVLSKNYQKLMMLYVDYKQSLFFLGPSSKTLETRKWPRAWVKARYGRGTTKEILSSRAAALVSRVSHLCRSRKRACALPLLNLKKKRGCSQSALYVPLIKRWYLSFRDPSLRKNIWEHLPIISAPLWPNNVELITI